MTKGLIAAIYLSQTLIQNVPAFHTPTSMAEYINADLDLGTRYINTYHFRVTDDRTMVVTKDEWYTYRTPVSYYQFWDCPWKQTAQQCVAIMSVIQQGTRK